MISNLNLKKVLLIILVFMFTISSCTKKDNRNFFIKTLKRNIYEKLSSFSFEIKDDYYRMFIYPKDENDLDKMLSSLKNIFGIHALAIVKMIEDNDIDSIKELALDEIKDKEVINHILLNLWK